MTRLAGVAFTAVCLASITGCQTSKQGYVAKGNKLYEAGKYSDAALNYRKAIQKDAQYGDAYYRLGLAEIKEQKPREALQALYRAVALLPNSIDAKEQLGSLTLEYYLVDPHRPQSYYDEVKRISDDLLTQNPKSFEGLREKAYLALTDGKREEANTLLRKAVEAQPSDAVVTTALVQNLIETGQAQEAEKIALDLIARQKSYGHLYDVLYLWYLKDNRTAEAENILKAKVNNNPKEGAYQVQLAGHYARMRKTAEMQATLQRLLDNPKDFPQARMLVGDFYLKLRNYPEAVRYYEEGARSSKDQEKVVYQKRATDALLAEGKGEQASSTVDRIVEENPTDEEARRVQANLLLRSGNPEKIEAAQKELEDLSKQKPDDASLWLGIGLAEELRGNPDAARASYLDALKKNPNFLRARYALAEMGLLRKRPDETLQQANEILKIRPTDARARLLRAQAMVRSGNPASARVELTRLIKDFPASKQAQVELGLLALSEKKYPEAEEIFSKLRDTGDPRAFAGLARSYSSRKQFDKAIQVLNEGLKKKSDSTLLLAQQASTEALAGKFDTAIAEFQNLIVLQPKSVQRRLQLADVYALKGDDASALTRYGEAAKLAPSDVSAGLEYAKALDRAGRAAEAKTQYEAVLKAHPDDALAMNDMAFFLAENGGNLEQALELAQRALAKVPNQPSFSDTIGCIYLKKGQRDSALRVFGNLVKKYPDYPTFRYHLGMALFETGDKKSAKRELESALAAHPSRQDQARIKELLGKIS